MIISDIRRINARALAKDVHGQAEFARRTGMPDSQVSQLIGENPTKNIGNKIARRIEEAFGKHEGWLDTPHVNEQRAEYEVQPARDYENADDGPEFKSGRKYPVISWVEAGEWTALCDNFQPGDAEEWRHCHIDLGKCGYVLVVRGESMTNPDAPISFPDGMLIYVNPEMEARPGRFVIVRRNATNEATFKRLSSIEGELYLEAINPRWPNRYLKLEPGDHICGVIRHAGFDLP